MVALRLDAAAVAPRVDYRLTLSGGDIPLGAMTAVVMAGRWGSVAAYRRKGVAA